jgi:rod shape-determining protein MreD
MALIIALPILGGLVILQSAVLSSMTLLHGTADLVMITILAWSLQDRVKTIWQWCLIAGIMMSFISGLPFGTYLGAYLIAIMIARFIHQRIWKGPFLGMLMVTFIGTLLVHGISWLARWISGVYIPFDQVLNLIIIPSLLLNIILAIPIYYAIRDLAGWLYPGEIVV